MIEEQLVEEAQNWNGKQWRDYLFQNGVMDIETFRQKCYDIVDEMIASKYNNENAQSLKESNEIYADLGSCRLNEDINDTTVSAKEFRTNALNIYDEETHFNVEGTI